jgi:adenylate kinase
MPARPPDLIVAGAPGSPGSGKSTLAARLAERLGAVHLNLGSLLRELAAGNSPLGLAIRAPVAEGRLAPDDVAEQVIRERLEHLGAEQSLILDGYPRSALQADDLHRLLADLGRLRPRPMVVDLDVPRDELRRRLARRRELEHRRDDTDEAIVRRLELDETQRAQLLGALAAWANVLHAAGDRPVDAVAAQIVEQLEDPEKIRPDDR